jgi:8-oxo-dGTP diphosphatase
MTFDTLTCPSCGTRIRDYTNPLPTVDIIIEIDDGIVLIERRNEPKGWALPGGFVDYGETLEEAAVREALEETSLSITELRLHGCYSDPARDRRRHTISTVFVAKGEGIPKAGDDAANIAVFRKEAVPSGLCFDHDRILREYLEKTSLP